MLLLMMLVRMLIMLTFVDDCDEYVADVVDNADDVDNAVVGLVICNEPNNVAAPLVGKVNTLVATGDPDCNNIKFPELLLNIVNDVLEVVLVLLINIPLVDVDE